ncbi:site-specific recombinase XerD [Dysgonomonas alginatilytica]|uniref:Site-specific recombinase XerD n=1 Tax=Dysgonomonas alginatilytica TaxID=1605892 RepID=A0A2V3PJ51_9BACT|nr:site-specific integrase [Dysgonomonas alginatilytica]PXV60095.1 site-specific recombinase XerD [Dysgonomonas alginatilytica]
MVKKTFTFDFKLLTIIQKKQLTPKSKPMATLTFFLRRSTKGGEHAGSLCLRITHERRSRSLTTPFKLYPNEWDNKTRRIKHPDSKSPRIKHLQQAEEHMKLACNTLQDIIDTFEEQGRYTIEDITGNYRLAHDSDKLLCYVEKQALSLIRSEQERTARAYRTVARGLVAFNKGKDIPLKHINNCLIKDFEKDMKQKGKTPNTISFYMRNLRAIYNKAIADKHIQAKVKNPFKEVYTAIQKTQKRALSMDEIQRLNALDLTAMPQGESQTTTSDQLKTIQTNAGLDQAKRLFFFSFHARGMSFVDLAYLRKENIRSGTISYYRKKTGGLIRLKVTAPMQEIIDSFSPEVIGSPYVFPIIKDQNKSHRLQYESGLRLQNSRLKKLSALAKLESVSPVLSTHVARHSWATLAKRENLPLWVISEGLGHSSEKMTYTYLASLDQNVVDHASDLITGIVTGSPCFHTAS